MSCLDNVVNCAEKIVHGATGLAKAALHIDMAPLYAMQDRRNHCRNCEHVTRNLKRIHLPTKGLTTLSRCKLCDCNVAAKTQIAAEICPIKKWLAVAAVK